MTISIFQIQSDPISCCQNVIDELLGENYVTVHMLYSEWLMIVDSVLSSSNRTDSVGFGQDMIKADW
jgi:hypothetical protein